MAHTATGGRPRLMTTWRCRPSTKSWMGSRMRRRPTATRRPPRSVGEVRPVVAVRSDGRRHRGPVPGLAHGHAHGPLRPRSCVGFRPRRSWHVRSSVTASGGNCSGQWMWSAAGGVVQVPLAACSSSSRCGALCLGVHGHMASPASAQPSSTAASVTSCGSSTAWHTDAWVRCFLCCLHG